MIRLDSWKAIANYVDRNVRTVQRWEMLEAMPVHRHCHDTGHSVYAYEQEIDAWRSNRSQKRRPTLRVSAIRQTPLDSVAPAEQSALLRSLVVLVKQLQEMATRSTAGTTLPTAVSCKVPSPRAWSSPKTRSGPRPAEHKTTGDTVRRPLFVACGRLKVDQ